MCTRCDHQPWIGLIVSLPLVPRIVDLSNYCPSSSDGTRLSLDLQPNADRITMPYKDSDNDWVQETPLACGGPYFPAVLSTVIIELSLHYPPTCVIVEKAKLPTGTRERIL